MVCTLSTKNIRPLKTIGKEQDTMLWVDYNIESFPDGSFTVKGEWPGEVMGRQVNGDEKEHWLYKPGDVFIVDESGILRKSDQLSALIMKYENKNDV